MSKRALRGVFSEETQGGWTFFPRRKFWLPKIKVMRAVEVRSLGTLCFFTLALDTRGSAAIIRADDRARRSFPGSIHRIFAAAAAADAAARARAVQGDFFGREEHVLPSKVATLHAAPDL